MHSRSATAEALPSSPMELGKESDSEKKPKRKRHREDRLCKGQQLQIYPTPEQAALLRQWIGSTRFLWNWALDQQHMHFAETKSHLAQKALSAELTALKKSDDLAWLAAVPRTALTMTLRHLDKGWTAFFDGQKGKRADAPGQPVFRRRGGSKESINFQIDERHASPIRQEGSASNLAGGYELRLPGIGWVLASCSEPVKGDVSSVTVRQQGTKWLASLALINVDPKSVVRKPGKAVVFDFPNGDPTCLRGNPGRVGLAGLDASGRVGAVVSSEGQTTYSLFQQRQLDKAKRLEERRQAYERVQSRKRDMALGRAGVKRTKNGHGPKGCNASGKVAPKSRREERVSLKIASLNLKELFLKRDAIHQFTTRLVREHHTVVVETLVLKDMMASDKGRRFRKQMHDACMGEIIRQIKYKARWYGRNLIFVDKWFASSKRCSNPACHQKHSELKSGDKAWTCRFCGVSHLRDDNAAFNLWQEGWRLLEAVFQKNDTDCLAAGSVVKGPQGKMVRGPDPREAKLQAPKARLKPSLPKKGPGAFLPPR